MKNRRMVSIKDTEQLILQHLKFTPRGGFKEGKAATTFLHKKCLQHHLLPPLQIPGSAPDTPVTTCFKLFLRRRAVKYRHIPFFISIWSAFKTLKAFTGNFLFP